MTKLLSICVVVWAFTDICHGVSTKMDFEEDQPVPTVVTNSSKEDEDVEVKHTIIVSTKLKNNNRRGVHGTDDTGAVTYTFGRDASSKKDDSGEVPVMKGYKAVESTIIRTPDTRIKLPKYPDSVFINRNIRDDYDIYPNVATNPMQWKPITSFNNVNWWNQDNVREFNNFGRNHNNNFNPGKLHRKITDDGIKEFYCRKCREMSGPSYKDCVQQRSNSWYYESTTPKIKIDGKLAKLN